MSLVRNGNRNSGGVSASTINLLMPAITRVLGQAVGAAIKQASNGSSGQSGQGQGLGGGGNSRTATGFGGTRRRGRKRQNKQGGQGAVSTGSVPRPVVLHASNNRTLRVVMRGVNAVANTATGTAAYVWPVGYSQGAAGTLLYLLSGKDKSVFSAFDYFQVNSIQVRISGNAGTTGSGFHSIGWFDSSAAPNTPTSISMTVASSKLSQSAQLGAPVSVTIPRLSDKLYLMDITQDAVHRQDGFIVYYSTNPQVSGDTSALVEINADLTLW